MGDLSASASSVHVGHGLGLLSHSFNISLKHASQTPRLFSSMASKVSGEISSSTPTSYHFDLASQTALCTARRSLIWRQPAAVMTREHDITSCTLRGRGFVFKAKRWVWLTRYRWLRVLGSSRGGSLTVLSVGSRDYLCSCWSSYTQIVKHLVTCTLKQSMLQCRTHQYQQVVLLQDW